MQLFKRLLVVMAMLPLAQVAQSAPFLYIPTYDNTGKLLELSVIDTADGSHEAQLLPRAPGKIQGIAFHPTSKQMYVALTNSINVINMTDNSVSAQIDVPAIVRILLNPDGSLLYIETDTDTKVFDTATNTVVGTTTLIAPYQLAVFHPNGTRLLRIKEGTGSGATLTMSTLEMVDVASGAVVQTFEVGFGTNKKGTNVGSGSHDIAINAAGTRVYVMNGYSALNSEFNTVSVIDLTNANVLATIPLGNLPAHIAINPAGTRLYATIVFSEDGGIFTSQGTVKVIDTASNTVVDTVKFGEAPQFVGVDAAGTVYVQSQKDTGVATLSVLDSRCNTVTGTINQAVVGGFFEKPYPTPPVGPIGPTVPGANHVQITGVEVTQGIQDLANSVPLYGGRRTFVRVYVKSDGPLVPGVTAILSGVGNIFCSPGSCPPSGSSLVPLVPINSVGTRLKVGPDPKRYNMNDSFLFELPWEWTSYQSLHLLAAISQGPGLVPTQSCRNDVLNAPLYEFETGFDTLKVQFVRLSYELPITFNGVTNALHVASPNEQLQSESYIRRTYPLSELVIAPDYPLFDAGLGSAVARTLVQCAAMPADQRPFCARNYISDQLAMLQATTGFKGDADVIYGLIPQVPNDPNSLLFTRGACCTEGVGAGPADSNDYAAHEIGHFFGRQHPLHGAALCGHSATDPDYPYDLSSISPPFADVSTNLTGFDRGEPNLLIERSTRSTMVFGSGTVAHYDTMGYCKPSWISDYTYKHLHTCLEALHGPSGIAPGCGPAGVVFGASAPQSGDWLGVFGSITPELGANIVARRVDRNYAPPRSASGSHKIRLLGAGGATLAEYPFTPNEVDDTAAESFGQVVPYVAGTHSIEIVDATTSTVIGQEAVSPNAPAVSGVALQGSPDPTTGLVTLNWNASDVDGDTLTYDIFSTRDSGSSLRPLLLGVTAKTAQVDTLFLAGGSTKLRVVATDGVQSGFADTTVFTLANKPPKPRILNPGDGSSIHVGQLINMEGTATDAQDGVLTGTHLAWSVSGQSVGSGPKLSITNLSAGLNQVTLTATNSLGLSASTTASVTVLPNVDMPGPTLTAGPMQIGWHLAAGDSALQTAPLEIGNSGGGTLDFTAVSSAPWLTLSSPTGTAPATIILTANPAGFAEGNTGDATVTVTAAGSPDQVIRIPAMLSVGNTFVVARTAPGVVAPPPPADFVIAASDASGSVTAGQTAQTTLTVTPSNGLLGSVALTCSGLPASATCNFSPASLDIDAGAETATLTIATTTRTAMNVIRGPHDPPGSGELLFAAICVPLALRPRRKLYGARNVALLALLCVGIITLQGCSGGGHSAGGPPDGGNPGGGSVGTPAGTYNVTITATSGSTTHTVVYALTVS